MPDGFEADGPELKGLFHRPTQFSEIEVFQRSQQMHAVPPAMLRHARLHQAAQRGEFLRQIPALERGCLIQRIDLLLNRTI